MKMRVCHCLSITMLLAVTGCSATPELQADADDRDPIVCKNEMPTGSHLPKRVCRRQSEIDASQDPALRKFTDRLQDHSPGAEVRSPGGSGGSKNR